MPIDVRQACSDDAAPIAKLGRVTFREAFGSHFQQHPRDLAAYLQANFSVAKIAASIEKTENRFWVASIDGRPVGYAKRKYPSPNFLIDDPSAVQLQKIYVRADHLSSGAGHALMTAVADDARELDASMWLAVLASNDRAIGFYERHGWAEAGRTTFTIGVQVFPFLVLQKGRSASER